MASQGRGCSPANSKLGDIMAIPYLHGDLGRFSKTLIALLFGFEDWTPDEAALIREC